VLLRHRSLQDAGIRFLRPTVSRCHGRTR
jgi:hypothetical protein